MDQVYWWIWEYIGYNKIQFRAISYSWVQPNTPLDALKGGISWNSCQVRQHINMEHTDKCVCQTRA